MEITQEHPEAPHLSEQRSQDIWSLVQNPPVGLQANTGVPCGIVGNDNEVQISATINAYEVSESPYCISYTSASLRESSTQWSNADIVHHSPIQELSPHCNTVQPPSHHYHPYNLKLVTSDEPSRK